VLPPFDKLRANGYIFRTDRSMQFGLSLSKPLCFAAPQHV